MTQHSYHIFSLPLLLKDGRISPLRDSSFRFLKDIIEESTPLFKHKGNESGYNHDADKYNFKNIFHLFAYDVLWGNSHESALHYRKIFTTDTFLIIDKGDKEYRLDVDAVGFSLYSTNVAIVSIFLSNYTYTDFEDVCMINELGRRLYPPFRHSDKTAYESLNLVKSYKMLASSIRIEGEIKEIENFEYYTEPKILPRHIIALLPDDYKYKSYDLLLDDRMFVTSWVTENYDPEKWQSFLFMAKGKDPIGTNKDFSEKLLTNATYMRWADDTHYGATRFSFMCMTTPEGAAFTFESMRGSYFLMAHLCLAQYASIRKLIDQSRGNNIEKTYKNYLVFMRKINLNEVTLVEQSNDLFNLVQDALLIDKHSQELAERLEKEQEYGASTNLNNFVSVFGATIAGPSLLAGYYGINFFDKDNLNPITVFQGVLLPSIIWAIGSFGYFQIKGNQLTRFFFLVIAIVAIIFGLLSPILFTNN